MRAVAGVIFRRNFMSADTMAFHFVQSDEYEYLEDDEESEYSVLAYLGADPDTGASYYASAMLSPHGADVEYSFSVIERINDEERLLTSGLETQEIFQDQADRRSVLRVILELTECLLAWKEPAAVERCTADVVTNDEMLAKHILVSQIFRKCGYNVTDCGDWNGQKIWRAERIAEQG